MTAMSWAATGAVHWDTSPAPWVPTASPTTTSVMASPTAPTTPMKATTTVVRRSVSPRVPSPALGCHLGSRTLRGGQQGCTPYLVPHTIPGIPPVVSDLMGCCPHCRLYPHPTVPGAFCLQQPCVFECNQGV